MASALTRRIAVIAALSAAVPLVVASPVTTLAQSSDVIVRALTPKAKKRTLVRSFRRQDSEARGIAIGGTPEPAGPPRIDLTVNFEFDSARLTNDALIVLAELGTALKDPRLQGMRFQIIGHTDGRGDAFYNRELSERRAYAVVEHLMFAHNVEPARMMPLGFGESQLIRPDDPGNAVNRRVEIINISPGS
ncbi:MAG: OmpA family protein [Pseudomonadota bacterium]